MEKQVLLTQEDPSATLTPGQCCMAWWEARKQSPLAHATDCDKGLCSNEVQEDQQLQLCFDSHTRACVCAHMYSDFTTGEQTRHNLSFCVQM